jgi:hypothetical protein
MPPSGAPFDEEFPIALAFLRCWQPELDPARWYRLRTAVAGVAAEVAGVFCGHLTQAAIEHFGLEGDAVVAFKERLLASAWQVSQRVGAILSPEWPAPPPPTNGPPQRPEP